MPAVMIGAMVAGAAISAYGQVKAGRAAKAAGEYNASVAELEAKDAIERGQQAEERYRLGVKTLIGSQRAGFAGQNVDIGTGSPVDVQADAAFLGELDALTIRQNAQREAWGYRVQGQQAKTAGEQQANAYYFGAASTALGTTASILQTRYGWGTKR